MGGADGVSATRAGVGAGAGLVPATFLVRRQARKNVVARTAAKKRNSGHDTGFPLI